MVYLWEFGWRQVGKIGREDKRADEVRGRGAGKGDWGRVRRGSLGRARGPRFCGCRHRGPRKVPGNVRARSRPFPKAPCPARSRKN